MENNTIEQLNAGVTKSKGGVVAAVAGGVLALAGVGVAYFLKKKKTNAEIETEEVIEDDNNIEE